ncbi:MAG: hydrogenase maturation protease [Epsilonproteobacteria bacterium]|nr:Ni/Fe hydrogenase [Campylobacterota bacterium]NPA57264.1 hydrogenase maturation protease [Campylobacterota bacterium]
MKTAIIGVGNILFMDEGVGVYGAQFLKQNYSIEAEIVDGGTLGFKLMGYYQEYEKVIIIDTVSIDDTPGSIYNLPSHLLLGLGSYRKTAHEVEVVEMLEICSLLDNHAQVTVVGIVPEDIESVGIGLTPRIRESFPNLIGEVLAELERSGIGYRKRRGSLHSLDSIIESYANPQSEVLSQ